MGFFRQLEAKAFLGKVVLDYGVIEERSLGIGRTRVSLLMCERKGKPEFVIKESNVAFLSASVRYTYVHWPEMIAFRDAVNDACQWVEGAVE